VYIKKETRSNKPNKTEHSEHTNNSLVISEVELNNSFGNCLNFDRNKLEMRKSTLKLPEINLDKI